MHFEVKHQLRYTYSKEVFLEPTIIRLRPRDDFAQKLDFYKFDALPNPADFSDSLDIFNNYQTELWFTEKQSSLTLNTHFKVETTLSNPFHYLVTSPQVLKLPAKYSVENKMALAPYLHRIHPDAAVDELAQTLLNESDDNTLNYLYHMTDYIHRNIQQTIRAIGEPLLPNKTLRRKEGACRDLAVLFIDLCRAMGLAARFVSGYKYDPGARDSHELHAWAEVYLTGAGWRGYDPSLGLAVADHHIALAAGPMTHDAAALSGAFRGTDVLTRMDYEIEIKSLETAKKIAPGQTQGQTL
jgi:transglutaminase-like putative cysteine protease